MVNLKFTNIGKICTSGNKLTMHAVSLHELMPYGFDLRPHMQMIGMFIRYMYIYKEFCVGGS